MAPYRWTERAPYRTVLACIADELSRIATACGQHAATTAAVHALHALRGELPMDVIVRHRHATDASRPWQWETLPPADPRKAVEVSPPFASCEDAVADAERRGHRVVDVRE